MCVLTKPHPQGHHTQHNSAAEKKQQRTNKLHRASPAFSPLFYHITAIAINL